MAKVTFDAGKVRLTPRGNWNASTNYTVYDCVQDAGATWLAVAPSRNIRPAEGAYWALLLGTGGDAVHITDGNGLTIDGAVKAGIYSIRSYTGADCPALRYNATMLVSSWGGGRFVTQWYLVYRGTGGISIYCRTNITTGNAWTDWVGYANATSTSDGLMSYRDKNKLDAMAAYMQANFNITL